MSHVDSPSSSATADTSSSTPPSSSPATDGHPSTAASPSSPPMPVDVFESKFFRSLHSQFILNLDKHPDTFEYCATEHLKMSGVYWAVMTMELIGSLPLMDRAGILRFVQACHHPASGGFSGNVGHDPHLLYTLSAVQILLILDADDLIPRSAVTRYVASLQQPDGSFSGDAWGEVDTRFSYCALSCLSLLSSLHLIDLPLALRFIAQCRNFDGGFGAVPGAESHSGQIFVCVAALAVGGALEGGKGEGGGIVDAGVLGWWLAERQLAVGGLNGRPEKKPDVCYSWWVLSSLSMLRRMHWIDGAALGQFVLSSQDGEEGGISDRPGNMADPFHTFFGIAALSLLGYRPLQAIDPVYAMPARCIERLGIGKGYQRM